MPWVRQTLVVVSYVIGGLSVEHSIPEAAVTMPVVAFITLADDSQVDDSDNSDYADDRAYYDCDVNNCSHS